MAVGELVVSIIGDMKELSKTFSSVQKELGDVGKKFNDVGKSISSAGTSLTKRFTAPIVGAGLAFAGVAKEGMEFEKGMAQVYTLIPDMSKEAFGQMSADTLQFAKDMKVPTEEVLPALYDAIGSGVPQDNVFSFLEVAQKGAVAGATNVGVAVDTLTSLINAYGAENLSAADASDILFAGINVGKMSYEELQKSLSQVVPTAASLQIPLEQVVGALAAMTAQGTPTAQSTTQLSRLFNELAKEGTSAYDTFKEISGKSFPQFIKEGGTVEDALKLMKDGFMENSPAAKELEKRMRELVDPTSGLSLEFESLTGKTFKDFRKEGGDVSEAFKILGINTEEADGRLSDMFGSIEAGNAVLTLTSRDGAILTDVMDEMDRSAGQTDEAFAKMSDTTSYAFESISAEIKNATTEMGVNLLPIIQDTIVPLIIDTLIPAFEWAVGVIATVADAFNKLPQPVKVVILAVIAFIAALGPVLVVIGAVVSAIGTLAAAFGTGGILAGAISFITATVLPALSTAFGILVYTVIPIVVEAIALLATPLGLVAVALAAFALAWKYNWFDIQGKFQSVKKIIETAMKNFSDFLQRLWHGLVMAAGRLSTNLSTIWDIIKTVFSSTGDTIIQIVSKLYDWLQSTYDSILSAGQTLSTSWSKHWDNFKTTLSNAVSDIISKLQSWYTDTVTKFNQIKSVALDLLNDWKTHWENIKLTLSQAVSDVISKLQSWHTEILNKFNQVKTTALDLLNTWRMHWDNFNTAINTAVSVLNSILSTMISYIQSKFNLIENASSLILAFWRLFWSSIQSVTSSAASSLSNILSTMYSYIQSKFDLIKSAANGFYNALNSIWSIIASATTNFSNSINNILNYLYSVLQNIFGQIRNAASSFYAALNSIWESIKSITSSFSSSLQGIISSLYSSLQNLFNQIKAAMGALYTAIKTAWDNIVSAVKSAGSQLISAIAGLPGTIKGYASAFANAGKAILDALYNSIVDGFNKAIKKAKDMLSELRGYLPSSPAETGPFKKLPDWSSAISTPLKKSVAEASSTAKSAGSSIMNSVATGVKKAASKVNKSISTTFKKVRRYLPFSPAEFGPFSEIPDWDSVFVEPMLESIKKTGKLAVPLEAALGRVKSPVDSFSSGLGNISSISNTINNAGDTITIGPNTLASGVDIRMLIEELNKYTANKRRARGLYK